MLKFWQNQETQQIKRWNQILSKQLRAFVNVSVRTDHYSQINYVKFNILLGTDQSLWSSPAQALIIVPALNSPFLYYNRFDYFVVYQQDIAISFPQEWYSNINVPMFIMRGYHNPKFENIRLRFKNQRFQSNQIVATVGVCNYYCCYY